MERSIGWFFPLLGGGESHGLNDPGIETFKKSASLGRETIQNIGDARSDAACSNGDPAIAEFELLELSGDQIPDQEFLRAAFQAGLDRLLDTFSSEADRRANGMAFFKKGLTVLSKRSIPVLRIRDRNTTGLLGEDEDPSSPWSRLISSQGYSSSRGVGGGTYGIGQRAPFAKSDLRTIAYYTRTAPSAEAFVMKSILCTFLHPESEQLTQSTGWYCSRDAKDSTKWGGIRDSSRIPEFFRRMDEGDKGTDLFVLGYSDVGKNWQRELRRAVVRNFFAAIDQGSLVIHIKAEEATEVISSETLLDSIDRELVS
jgi:hypothetical protein